MKIVIWFLPLEGEGVFHQARWMTEGVKSQGIKEKEYYKIDPFRLTLQA